VTVHPVLLQGLERLGIRSTTVQLRQLESYRHELERWNRTFGFVKAEGEELVVRHFLDSLAGLGAIAELAGAGRIADVGSGAGFPGVPLAIMLPRATLTLVEPASRKAAFLRGVAILLELGNVTVAEKQLRELQGPFDLVTFRAFRPLAARELTGLRRLLAPGGAIVAYKGRRERVAAELRQIGLAGAGADRVKVVALRVPFLEEERHLVVLRSGSLGLP
jgi:16S rRNA (guanine527-N7)-methyltransferase